MEHYYTEHQESACLCIRGVDHGPEVPDEKTDAHGEAHADENPVQDRDGTPADHRDGDPDHIRIPVQRPALDEARGVTGPEPAQQTPQRNGDEAGVAVNEAGGAAQESKVVHKLHLVTAGQVLGNRAGEEEDKDDGGGDPERPVEVRVPVQNVEEGRARIECGGTAA